MVVARGHLQLTAFTLLTAQYWIRMLMLMTMMIVFLASSRSYKLQSYKIIRVNSQLIIFHAESGVYIHMYNVKVLALILITTEIILMVISLFVFIFHVSAFCDIY